MSRTRLAAIVLALLAVGVTAGTLVGKASPGRTEAAVADASAPAAAGVTGATSAPTTAPVGEGAATAASATSVPSTTPGAVPQSIPSTTQQPPATGPLPVVPGVVGVPSVPALNAVVGTVGTVTGMPTTGVTGITGITGTTGTTGIAGIAGSSGTSTTTTTVPTPGLPVCTDGSLDQGSANLEGLSLDQMRARIAAYNLSRATMIGSYARCVAEGGAIDPRHDDINGTGDGKYCGPNPPSTAGSTYTWAVKMQMDCYTDLASRDDF